jgi:HJR/Mrr/RecB family endonuclease
MLASLFYRPTDSLLPAVVAEAESQSRVASAHWREAFERLKEVKVRLASLIEERREKMASGRVQRAALLQRPWKTMPAAEWEDFVVEVCRTLGATVDRRGHSEDGAELVVDFGPRRVAAVVKTSREAIDSGAVQDAIALKEREACDACAIITNGRFTGAAQDFAPGNGCKLIGREEFPDFVLGQTEW